MTLAYAADAKEHIVIVMDNTFFPTVSYVEAGDTVRFVNTSKNLQTISSNDAGWIIGPLAQGQEAVLSVVENINLEFRNTGQTGALGALSFERTPLK